MAKNEYHEYLKRVPLFRDLDAPELDAVSAVVTDLRFNAGETLIRQGDAAQPRSDCPGIGGPARP